MPSPRREETLPIEANAANHLQGTMLASSRGTLPHCELLNQNPKHQTDPRKTKGMRTLVSTENPHAYFLGCI